MEHPLNKLMKPGSTVFSEITLRDGSSLLEGIARLTVQAGERGVRCVVLLVAPNHDYGIGGHIIDDAETINTLESFLRFVGSGGAKFERAGRT